MSKKPTEQDLVDSLVSVLSVEQVELNFFRGIATPQGRGRSFGGQVIGQALASASHTIDDPQIAHSLHGYFMRPGDATKPVLYQVERDHDGRSFATRRVVAIQNGKPILNLACSFHKPESGMSHQDEMPDVPPPEELESEVQLGERYKDRLPEAFLQHLNEPRATEMRPTVLRPPFTSEKQPAIQNVWFKVCGKLPDDPNLHRAALAYASDYGLLGIAMLPHGKAFSDGDMQVASLDHAVWIHDTFRMDEWLLYSMDSPWAGGGRGYNRGRIFSRDGRLVANTSQEGLVRQITPRKP